MGRREGGWVGMIEEKEKGEETEGCKNWGWGKRSQDSGTSTGEGDREDTEFTFLLDYLRRRRRIDW